MDAEALEDSGVLTHGEIDYGDDTRSWERGVYTSSDSPIAMATMNKGSSARSFGPFCEEKQPEEGSYKKIEDIHGKVYEIDTSSEKTAGWLGVRKEAHGPKKSHARDLRASFYAGRMLIQTLVAVFVDTLGLVLNVYLLPTAKEADDIDTVHSSFHLFGESLCEDLNVFLISVCNTVILAIILCIPALGFKGSSLYTRHGKRRWTVRLCDSAALVMAVWLIVVLVIALMHVAGSLHSCQEHTDDYSSWTKFLFWLRLPIVVAVYVVSWKQIATYDALRNHTAWQISSSRKPIILSSARDRIPGRPPQPTSTFLRRGRSEKIRLVRTMLAAAADGGDIGATQAAIEEATGLLGPNWISILYAQKTYLKRLTRRYKANPLHIAASRGDVDMLRILLDSGFDVNSCDMMFPSLPFTLENIYGNLMSRLPWIQEAAFHRQRLNALAGDSSTVLWTPLHAACFADHAEVVEWLVEHGADMHRLTTSSSKAGRIPPLFLAKEESIRVLLRHNVNFLMVTADKITVLQKLTSSGRWNLARVLESVGADVTLTRLHAAAAANDTKTVSRLLHLGVDPNILGDLCVSRNLRTPLHWAAATGAVDAVRLLLASGADVNAQDLMGRTPLHWATLNGHEEVVRVLVASKDTVLNKRDNALRTAALCAAESDSVTPSLLKCLAQHGANLDDSMPNGDTPLHVAVRRGHLGTAVALVRAGSNVLALNREGRRPMDCTSSLELQYALKREAGVRDVMISYCHSHGQFARKVREALHRGHITSWMDTMEPSGIVGGADWRQEIGHGIMRSSVILCCLSENYHMSPWCLKELALASEMGKPVVGITCEDFPITDDLQLYLFRRQIIPFQVAVKVSVDGPDSERRFEFEEDKFETQMLLLLDGLKMELGRIQQRNRQSRISDGAAGRASDLNMDRSAASSTSTKGGGGDMCFIGHGDTMVSLARRISVALRSLGLKVFMDAKYKNIDAQERMAAAKDAILKSSIFIAILSRHSTTSGLLNDQLAFAEDRGIHIIGIIVSEVDLDPGKRLTMSRNPMVHFSAGGLGFEQSMSGLSRLIENIGSTAGDDDRRMIEDRAADDAERREINRPSHGSAPNTL